MHQRWGPIGRGSRSPDYNGRPRHRSSSNPDNVDRPLLLLGPLDPYQRYGLANRRLKPTREMLLETGQINVVIKVLTLEKLIEVK